MKGYLIDTHALIWFLVGQADLSQRARSVIESPAQRRFASVVSLWEIQILRGLGRIKTDWAFMDWVEPLAVHQIEILPLSVGHLDKLGELPMLHRDPFDRLLVAQALSEELVFVSRDKVIERYGVPTAW